MNATLDLLRTIADSDLVVDTATRDRARFLLYKLDMSAWFDVLMGRRRGYRA